MSGNHAANLIYCFDFKLANSEKIFLTSFEDKVEFSDKSYLPHSAIGFKGFLRQVNLEDVVIIKGIWEENGIVKTLNLENSELNITALLWGQKTSAISLSKYHFNAMKEREDGFEITYLGQLSKYRTNNTNFYSKLCRAEFGGKECGVHSLQLPQGTNCDKKFITCCKVYDNAVNFRGEPFIPEGKLV